METLKRIFLISLVCLPFFGESQIYFKKRFTSGPFDQGNGLTQLPDSSYAITGTSGGFNNESGEAFLMITDSLGNQKWTKHYGGTGDDIGVRVIHVPGDGFFIAGYTSSTALGDFDFVVYKTDEQGVLEWEKRYGNENWDVLHDAKLLADGGLILVGETEGSLTDGKDIFMVRTTPIGDTVWTKIVSSPQDDVAYAVDTLSNNQFVVGGDFGDFGILKGMIMGYHIDGTKEWQNFYHFNGISRVRDVVVFEDHIYLIGKLFNLNQTRYDMWYAKGDLNGNYQDYWVNDYQESAMFTAGAIRAVDGIYLGMQSKSPELNPYDGGNDAFVLRFETNMYFQGFSGAFSGVDEDRINEVIVTNDGGIAFVGTASDDPVNSSLGNNVMFVKLGPNDENVLEFDIEAEDLLAVKNEKEKSIRVYPNPTSNVIKLPNTLIGKQFEIRNIQGKIVRKGLVSPEISMKHLDIGMYFLKVVDQNETWSTKILKK